MYFWVVVGEYKYQGSNYGSYLKMGSLPKKVMNVINEMPRMTRAISLRETILLKSAAHQLSSWLFSLCMSRTSQGNPKCASQKTTIYILTTDQRGSYVEVTRNLPYEKYCIESRSQSLLKNSVSTLIVTS